MPVIRKSNKPKGATHKAEVVTKLGKHGTEEIEMEDVPLPYSQGSTRVKVALGYTKNLGNFSSFRVDVSLEVPCREYDKDDVYEDVYQWVDSKMTSILAEVE